jgi:hypothetical protein
MILRNSNFESLLTFLELEELNAENTEHLELIHQVSIGKIQTGNGELTQIPPFEKHPYLENIDCTKTTGLMIGTFPPISYLCDQLNLQNLSFNEKNIKPPIIPYFHGNRASLWSYCPINYEEEIRNYDRACQPQRIKNVLLERKIAYTDIILFCQRKLKLNKKKGQ